MNIIIAGDFCPHHRASVLIEEEKFAGLFSEVQSIVSGVDYAIVNFECPVVKGKEKPIEKQGPSLRCSEKGMEVIKWVGFKCVTLANNHILDYGRDGMKNTICQCDKHSIDYVGGGMNLTEASKVLYKEIEGKKLAVVNSCEHEFSIATEDTPGSNPLNPIQQYYFIKEARQKADYVIVIVHGGIEHCQYPTHRMVETYRFFVDAGADAVINHHQHCPCGYEEYKGKPIFYGIGNFCFDWEGRQNSIWNQGYMVKLSLIDKSVFYEIIPYVQGDKNCGVRLMKENVKESFILQLQNKSKTIEIASELDRALKSFMTRHDFLYRKMLTPYTGRVATALFRRGLLPSFINKKRMLALSNFIKCESHYERVCELLDRLRQK